MHRFLLMLCFSTTLSALMEKLVTPLQDKIEEWKKTAALLDKDHAKGMAMPEFSFSFLYVFMMPHDYSCFYFCITEYKRSRQEIKKKSSDTLKLQKKARKGVLHFNAFCHHCLLHVH